MVSGEWRATHSVGQLLTTIVLGLLLAGCGGAPRTPTPLPAAVRPAQPAPVYPVSTAFTSITTTQSMVTLVSPTVLSDLEAVTPVAPSLDLATVPLPPLTGMGIIRGGAALLAQPNGAVQQQLPAGAVVTITGKSADEAWVAVYDDQGHSGWLAAARLVLLGTETLTVVTTAAGPGLAATLVAQAMEPVAMPTIVLTITVTP